MPLYVHSIVTSEQVTRFGTVKKAMLVVAICESVRQDGGGEKCELP